MTNLDLNEPKCWPFRQKLTQENHNLDTFDVKDPKIGQNNCDSHQRILDEKKKKKKKMVMMTEEEEERKKGNNQMSHSVGTTYLVILWTGLIRRSQIVRRCPNRCRSSCAKTKEKHELFPIRWIGTTKRTSRKPIRTNVKRNAIRTNVKFSPIRANVKS